MSVFVFLDNLVRTIIDWHSVEFAHLKGQHTELATEGLLLLNHRRHWRMSCSSNRRLDVITYAQFSPSDLLNLSVRLDLCSFSLSLKETFCVFSHELLLRSPILSFHHQREQQQLTPMRIGIGLLIM